MKLRTFSSGPTDVALSRNNNPLKRRIRVHPSAHTTADFLNQYRSSVDLSKSQSKACVSFFFYLPHWIVSNRSSCRIFYDKHPPGWLVWSDAIILYAAPDNTNSTFQPWEASSAGAVEEVRKITTSPKFWENVSVYYAEENHETTIILDNVSCIKSICKSCRPFLDC